MGTTKWKVCNRTPLLFLKRSLARELKVEQNKMHKKKSTLSLIDQHFSDLCTSHLDAHLEVSLDSDAELIISRKIEEEAEEDLCLIFK